MTWLLRFVPITVALEPLADDQAFRADWRQGKQANKGLLASLDEVLGRDRMHFNLEVEVAKYLTSPVTESGARHLPRTRYLVKVGENGVCVCDSPPDILFRHITPRVEEFAAGLARRRVRWLSPGDS